MMTWEIQRSVLVTLVLIITYSMKRKVSFFIVLRILNIVVRSDDLKMQLGSGHSVDRKWKKKGQAGGHEEILADQWAQMRGGGGGRGVSANEYSC